MIRYDVQAVNTATASNNRIHDDEVAKAYGFSGGLVPGVDVYAYLVHLPAEQWGVEWLLGRLMRGCRLGIDPFRGPQPTAPAS
ncbi:hypothetical protein BH20ACT4_BH20ACT4_03630 [soil metagenome]